MRADVPRSAPEGSSMHTGSLAHPRRPLRWLAIGLGGALVLALLFAQVVRASSHTAHLTELSLSVGTLSPDFDSNVRSYTASVGSGISEVTVTATAETDTTAVVQDADGVVLVPEDVAKLTAGANTTIRIKVTRGDDSGITATYTVVVTRASKSDATLKDLKLSDKVMLSPMFNAGTASYAASVPYDLRTIADVQRDLTVTAMAADADATVSLSAPSGVTDTDDASGDLVGAVDLNVGDNLIVVNVLSADSSDLNSYRVVVTRAGNAKLAATAGLSITGGTLSPAYAANKMSYNASVPSDTSQITLTAMAAEASAKVTVQANGEAIPDGDSSSTNGHQATVDLNVGANTIKVMVTSGDMSETYTVMVERFASTEPRLSQLTLTGPDAELSPDFEASVRSYTASVGSGTSQITVTPTAETGSTAVVQDAGGVPLPGGVAKLTAGANTTIRIKVTRGGNSRTYTVVVTRASKSDATLKDLKLSDKVMLSPMFNAGTASYAASAPYDLRTIADVQGDLTVTAMAADADATVSLSAPSGVTDTDDASGDLVGAVDLNVGDNLIVVNVLSADGNASKSYRVVVTRAGNAKLAATAGLSITVGTLSPAYAANKMSYNASVPSDTSEIMLTPAAADSDAKVTVQANGKTVMATAGAYTINLNLGANTIKVMVASGDMSETYTVMVIRGPSAALSGLNLSGIALNQAFASNTLIYTAEVPSTVSSTYVTATPLPGATVEIPKADDQGMVNLSDGANAIKVIVTSSDGLATVTYTVTVTRQGGALDSLDLMVGDAALALFEGKFNPDRTSYATSVGSDTAEITVTAMAADTSGTVSIKPDDDATSLTTATVTLKPGSNKITATVTPADGTAPTIYTVNVFRVHLRAQLTALSLGDGVALKPGFKAGTTHYTASVDNATEQVTVRATGSPNSLVVIGPVEADAEAGVVRLGEGDNTITVEVSHGTGNDKVTTVYMIVVNREAGPERVNVPVPGPTVTKTVKVPGPTRTVTKTETVTQTVEVPAQPNVIGGTGMAMATEVDGRVLITRHDGGPSLVVDIGGFIRDDSFGQTYQVVRRADGMIVRQWVSPNSPLVYQINWAVVNSAFTVPVGVVGAIPLDDQVGAPGQLVRRFDGGDDRIFSYEMGQWRHVPNIPTFQALGFYWCDVTAADSAFFDRISIGAPHPATGMAARGDYPNCSTG